MYSAEGSALRASARNVDAMTDDAYTVRRRALVDQPPTFMLRVDNDRVGLFDQSNEVTPVI